MADEYHVIDTHTKAVVGKFKQGGRARAFRDKKDNEYGAVRYQIHPIYHEDNKPQTFKEQLDEKARDYFGYMYESLKPDIEGDAEKIVPRVDLMRKRMHRLRSGE